MKLLALDLGTKCGYAHWKSSGVWDLKPKTTQSAGQRYRDFKNHLVSETLAYAIDFIIYEEVHAHVAIDTAHVYGGLQAILQTHCLEHSIEYTGIGVGTIKKHATKNGHAKKQDMIVAAVIKWPSLNIIDDNHADALWLLDYAQTHLAIS